MGIYIVTENLSLNLALRGKRQQLILKSESTHKFVNLANLKPDYR